MLRAIHLEVIHGHQTGRTREIRMCKELTVDEQRLIQVFPTQVMVASGKGCRPHGTILRSYDNLDDVVAARHELQLIVTETLARERAYDAVHASPHIAHIPTSRERCTWLVVRMGNDGSVNRSAANVPSPGSASRAAK